MSFADGQVRCFIYATELLRLLLLLLFVVAVVVEEMGKQLS